MDTQTNRKLAAILFSDIVDCTKIISKDEKLGLEYIRQHSLIVNDNVDKFNGKLLKELGDGCLLIFDSTYDAVKFSNHIQEIINTKKDFKVRIGIHIGDIIKEGDDYLGSGVNIASRIHAFANPGETCFTQDVYSQIKSHTEIISKLIGKKDIKGISDKMEIFKIISEEKTSVKSNKSQKTLINEINNRRVPQFLGFYAAAGWSLIQFVDWLTIRYQYSPHLVDLSLGIVLSMIPSIIILSYFHGAPGKDKWNRIEKIGIPLNIIASLIVMIVMFYPKDLGATTETVTYEDEEGNNIKRVIPKVEFRKRVLLFNFKVNDSMENSWLSYGIPESIEWELMQDIYVSTSNQLSNEGSLGDYNLDKMDIVPISLQRQIAKKKNMQFYFNGEVNIEDQIYIITTNLYNTKSGKIISKEKFKGDNIFELFDQISYSIRTNMGIPQAHLDENIDLPASEIITDSFEAFKNYTQGMIVESDGGGRAIAFFEKAVEIDKTFALGYFMLQNAYVMNNKGDKRLGAIQKVLEYDYKLPERMKFIPRVMYYWETKQPEKNLKMAEMQLKLYPDNIIVYEVLRELYGMKREFGKLINAYSILLDQYKGKFQENKDIAYYFIKTAKLYLYKLNDYQNAKKSIDDYLYYYKEDSEPYELLAKIYQYQGNNDKAIEMYETALTFNLDNILIMCEIERLKDLEIQRIENLKGILNQCKSKHDTAVVYLNIGDLNRIYGQYDQSIEYIEKAIELKKQYEPFMYYQDFYYHMFAYLAQNGKYEIAHKKLQEFDETLQYPFSGFSLALHLEFYMAAEKWDILEEILKKVRDIYLEWGFQDTDALLAEAYVAEKIDKDYSKAIDLYKQVLSENLAYKLSDVHINIARCYRLLNNHKEAINKLNEVVNSTLYYKVDANYQFAMIYKEKGNIKKAINYIDLMLEHYKHADPTLIKVNRAKSLKEDLNKQL